MIPWPLRLETWELFMVLQESRISLISLCCRYSYLTFLCPRTCCYFCYSPIPTSLLFLGLLSPYLSPGLSFILTLPWAPQAPGTIGVQGWSWCLGG
uniref:Uncharacterized protein n=1 Tax=Bos indicus x Bos taurus TaxID=30522 RepID=A0A4W2BNX5_BOBOX